EAEEARELLRAQSAGLERQRLLDLDRVAGPHEAERVEPERRCEHRVARDADDLPISELDADAGSHGARASKVEWMLALRRAAVASHEIRRLVDDRQKRLVAACAKELRDRELEREPEWLLRLVEPEERELADAAAGKHVRCEAAPHEVLLEIARGAQALLLGPALDRSDDHAEVDLRREIGREPIRRVDVRPVLRGRVDRQPHDAGAVIGED